MRTVLDLAPALPARHWLGLFYAELTACGGPSSLCVQGCPVAQLRCLWCTGPGGFFDPRRGHFPAGASKSNVVVLSGAATAAGLLFAGGVFHFTRRGQLRSRKRTVADRHGVRWQAVSWVAANPSPMTTDWADDLTRKLRELRRDRPGAPEACNLPLSHEGKAVSLPHAAGWLTRPKAKPRTGPVNRQLADA